jgi:hypothetical protein
MQVDILQNPPYEELLIENVRLKAEIASLKRLIFGQKRERFFPVRDDQQLVLSGFDQKNQPQFKTE